MADPDILCHISRCSLHFVSEKSNLNRPEDGSMVGSFINFCCAIAQGQKFFSGDCSGCVHWKYVIFPATVS